MYFEFILNYDKLFLPRSDKLVFGDKRLQKQNRLKTIIVPCLTKHNSLQDGFSRMIPTVKKCENTWFRD